MFAFLSLGIHIPKLLVIFKRIAKGQTLTGAAFLHDVYSVNDLKLSII